MINKVDEKHLPEVTSNTDTIENCAKTLETYLKNNNFTEASKCAAILQNKLSETDFNLPCDLIKLIAVFTTANSTLKNCMINSEYHKLYQNIKNYSYSIINAIKTMDISKINDIVDFLKQYNNDLINGNKIDNHHRHILSEIDLAIKNEDNLSSNLLISLATKRYFLSKELAPNLTKKNIFSVNFEKLVSLYIKLDKGSKDDTLNTLYKEVKTKIYNLIDAINSKNNDLISLKIKELENSIIDFEDNNPLFTKNHPGVANSLVFNDILSATCDDITYTDDNKIKTSSNLISALIVDDYFKAVNLAEDFDNMNSRSFTLRRTLNALSILHNLVNKNDLDNTLKIPLRNLYYNIKNHIEGISLAIKHSKEVFPRINKLNEFENYFDVLQILNSSSLEKFHELIDNMIISILNSSYNFDNNEKEVNKVFSEFIIKSLYAKYYCTAIRLADQLDLNNSFSFNLKQLVIVLEDLNNKLNEDNLDNDLKTSLSKIHYELEANIIEIINAIKNSDNIQLKINNLKTFTQKINSETYPIQSKHHRVINTIIVNVVIAIGCLGIGFPIALGLHYWKTGRVFFNEKNENKFNEQENQLAQNISSALGDKNKAK